MSANPRGNYSKLDWIASLPASEREAFLATASDAQIAYLLYDWQANARVNQLLPPGDWTHWLVLAGRGFGKTRVGAETVRGWCEEYPIIHLVGPTTKSVRDVMIQGESGIMNCFPPHQRPLYEPSKGMLTFHTGAKAMTFSADEPERLRGPQCFAYWFDEMCASRFAEEAWDNLMFGFRLGDRPRGIITSTPKPTKLLKGIMVDPKTHVTRGSSYENRVHLAPAFFDTIIRKYEGTRLGRQELNAEILEDTPGALWKRQMIDATRIKASEMHWDQIVRIVVAIDPAVSNTEDSDETGIVVAALARSGHVVIVDDLSLKGSPLDWAKTAVAAYYSRRADRIVGEVNNGGDLVEANIRGVAPEVAFRAVRASRGKAVRAEPVAALYEQGRVHHVGAFPELEDQMCGWQPGEASPDRMDALVWAVTELVVQPEDVETIVDMTDYGEISAI